MSKVTVVSMYNEGYNRMADYTIRSNFSEYCEIHGYNLIDFKIDNDFLEGRHPQWGKIKLLKQLVESGESDWYFFVDCDCLIMNTSIRLESFMKDDKFLIVPSGGGAPDGNLSESCSNDNIMSSQMLIKSCNESLDFLEEIWDAPDWPDAMDINEFDHEMRQIRISYKKNKWRSGIDVIEEKLLNRFWPTKNPYMNDSFPNINKNLWEPGDFIVHITSYTTDERIEIINLLTPFVGGKIGRWERNGDKIFFKPLVENLGPINLVLERNREQVISWNIESPNRKIVYWVYSDSINKGDVVKGYDANGSQISTYKIKT